MKIKSCIYFNTFLMFSSKKQIIVVTNQTSLINPTLITIFIIYNKTKTFSNPTIVESSSYPTSA